MKFGHSIHLMLIALAALLCVLPWFSPGTSLAQDAAVPRQIPIQIANDDFRIPEGYFFPFPPKREKLTSLLIHALFPNMTPLKGHESDVSRTIIILALDANHTTTLDYRLRTHEKLGAPYDQFANKYGLLAKIPTDINAVHKGRKRDEIYIHKNGDMDGFITCDIDGRYPSPGCTDEFLYRDLLLSVTYRKAFLPGWLSIEQSVKALFESFMRQTSLAACQRVLA